jgi:hypothetical protein
MREKFLLLERSIQHDLQAIEQLYDAIGTPTLTDEAGEDELGRFRHMFRYAYDVELDPQRLRLVLSKALQPKVIPGRPWPRLKRRGWTRSPGSGVAGGASVVQAAGA